MAGEEKRGPERGKAGRGEVQAAHLTAAAHPSVVRQQEGKEDSLVVMSPLACFL